MLGVPDLDRRNVTTAEAVISVRGLRKRYGDVEAVAGIDLQVSRGEIFAFRGPNGAGKTTTVEILEGFRERSGGEVSVLGVDPARATAAWRDRIGVVLQESQPEPGLTVRECLELYAGYYSAPRDIAETIGLVGLEGKADALAEQLSGGQRRRLDVALALVGDPELIPGRADDRHRPVRSTDRVGCRHGPARARQDRVPDHALHGRGREPRRPDRDHRRRTHRRRGNAGNARRARSNACASSLHPPKGCRCRRVAGHAEAASALRAGRPRRSREPAPAARAQRAPRLGARARPGP